MKTLIFGTLNVNGIKKIRHNESPPTLDLRAILTDIEKQQMDVLAIQETHLGEEEYLQKEKGFLGFFCNSENNKHHGTGILIRENLDPLFKKISPRVCSASFTTNKNTHVLFICGYAPHESLSEKCPEIRDTFYDDLQKALQQKKSDSITIIALDANAQTSYSAELPKVIGHFTKGNKINNNGHFLINFAAENNLFLTNTLFQHKMSRRSTWTAPYRPLKINGEIRRNPIRNQIDYILISKKHLELVTNSRSYNHIETVTDHNLVVMTTKIDLPKLYRPKPSRTPKIDLEKLQNPEIAAAYRQKVNENQKPCEEGADNNMRWTNIVETCLKSGEETLGTKETKNKPKENEEIKILSERNKTLRTQINDSKSLEKRTKLKEESKNVKKEINTKLKKIEEDHLDKKMEHLEKCKDENTKYFNVLREMQNEDKNKKASIIVKDEKGNVPGSNKEKIKVIQDYFQKTLAPEEMEDEFLSVPPCDMKEKFNAEEIQRIAKRLNNNKAAGPDKLHAEYIKHAPLEIFEQIADIYNNTACTGDIPLALVHGLLYPIQKPGKKKGPPENLRPIILLSILRKILTIALLQRIWDRLASKIPKSQAAYQEGRGTAEQVLALKLLIDKAITSCEYNIFILLLDMSKAFDTVNRKTLIKELEKILQPDEIHLLSILTNRPLISIHLDGETGEGFNTFVGICQGDCLSAVLFIFYLASALNSEPGEELKEDLKAFLEIYYADDLTYSTTSSDHRDNIKQKIPEKLKKFNLHVNASKTEEGEAPDRRPPPPPPPPPPKDPGTRILWSPLDWLLPPKMKPPDPSYKNIKLLGTKLDTKKDIEARKSKVWNPVKKFRPFFKSKRLSPSHKTRIYKTYIEPILLYNSETWTLTQTLEKSLDAFQRKLLRISLNYIYPKKISNKNLYNLTKERPISEKLKRRRLNLFGHILRLHPDTPAQKALQYYLTPHKRPVGRPPLTWLSQITKDLAPTLKHYNIKTPLTKTTLAKTKQIADDRTTWRAEVARSTRSNPL